MRKYILLAIMLLITILSGWGQTPTIIPEPLKQKLLSQGFALASTPFKAPIFSVKNLDSNQVSLSSLKGKVVFLNFWATWCPPCRTEMPSMERLSAELDKNRFTIMAVSQGEAPQKVKTFIETNGFTFPIYTDENNVTARLYGISAIPTTIIIDREGYFIALFKGGREWDTPEMVSILKELINLP